SFPPSVVKYSQEATIHGADNASTYDSVQFVSPRSPTVRVIQNPDNSGSAKGYDEALKHVTEDIFCVLNSDVEVSERWLNPIAEIFNNQPETAIIQPKILDYKNKNYFEYAGAAGGFIDKFGYPFCRGRLFHSIEKDRGQYND